MNENPTAAKTRFNFRAPDVERYIIDTYPTLTAREQAEKLGCKYGSLVQARQRLLEEGAIDPAARAYNAGWRQDVLVLMEELKGRFRALEMFLALQQLELAPSTVEAVKIRSTREGTSRWLNKEIAEEEGLLTPEEIAARFQGRAADTEKAMAYARTLKGYNKPWFTVEYEYLKEEIGRVSPAGAAAFLGRTVRGVEHKMTKFNLSMLDNQGHLSLPLVAEEMGVTTTVVERWIRLGRLVAERPPGCKKRLVVSELELNIFKKRMADGEFLEDGWCKVCNGHFKKRHNQSKKLYCSDECQHKAKMAMQRERSRRPYEGLEHECTVCGTMFPYGRRRLTCSDECSRRRSEAQARNRERLRQMAEVYGWDHPMIREALGERDEPCRTCGGKIPPTSQRRFYCTRSCAMAQVKQELEPRACRHCAGEFRPYSNLQLYCSSLCKLESMAARGIRPRTEATEKQCRVCEANFFAPKRHQVYCSEDCREVGTLKKKRGEDWQPYRPEERTCPHCRQPFLSKNKTHRYCSRDCAKEHRLIVVYHGGKRPERTARECETCFAEFMPRVSVQRFCSADCRAIARVVGSPRAS